MRTMAGSFSTAITVWIWNRRSDYHHAVLDGAHQQFLAGLVPVPGATWRARISAALALRNSSNQIISSQAHRPWRSTTCIYLMGYYFPALIPFIWFSKPPFGARAAPTGTLIRLQFPCRIAAVTSPYIVAVGGTLRPILRPSGRCAMCSTPHNDTGARIKLISGPLLQLPLYQPENPERARARGFWWRSWRWPTASSSDRRDIMAAFPAW